MADPKKSTKPTQQRGGKPSGSRRSLGITMIAAGAVAIVVGSMARELMAL